MMDKSKDVRWQQRFNNFSKAFNQLEKFMAEPDLNPLEVQGLIKAFEYTFELNWKTLQDLLKEKGYLDIVGPRPVIEQSFADGTILDGKEWMRMLKSRNLTSHTYNEEIAEEIVKDIRASYLALLKELKNKLASEETA